MARKIVLDGHAAAAVERLARSARLSIAELVQHALRLEEEHQRGSSPEPGRSSQHGEVVVESESTGTVVSLPQVQEEPSGAQEAASEGGGQTGHWRQVGVRVGDEAWATEGGQIQPQMVGLGAKELAETVTAMKAFLQKLAQEPPPGSHQQTAASDDEEDREAGEDLPEVNLWPAPDPQPSRQRDVNERESDNG